MTPSLTAVLDQVLLLNALLTRDLTAFEQRHGLTTARVHLLWQLGAGGPATQSALAVALAVSPRNVTGLVDGLVGSGHVTREPHPGDRRATLVTLTAEGESFVQELQHSHRALADQLFAAVDHAELATFARVLDRTTARLAELLVDAS